MSFIFPPPPMVPVAAMTTIKLALESSESDGPFVRIQLTRKIGQGAIELLQRRALELYRMSHPEQDLDDAKVYLTYRDTENDRCFILSVEDLQSAMAFSSGTLRVLARVEIPAVSNASASTHTAHSEIMDEKDRQATAVYKQWQESYVFLQKVNLELVARIEALEDQTSAAADKGFNNDEDSAEMIASLNRKVQMLEDRVTEANDNAAKFEQGYNVSVSEKKSLEGQLATITQEYDEMLGQEDHLRQAKMSLERKVGELESNLNAAKSLVKERAERITVLERKLSTTESRLAEKDDEVKQKFEALLEMEKEIASAERDQFICAERITVLERELSTTQSRLAEKHDEVVDWKEKYDDMVKEKADGKQKFEALLEMDNEIASAKRAQFTSKISELEAKVWSLENEKAGLTETASLLAFRQDRIKELEGELESLRSRMGSVASALEEARRGKGEDRAKIVDLESALQQCLPESAKLVEALDRISELEKELRGSEENFASDSEEADEIINQYMATESSILTSAVGVLTAASTALQIHVAVDSPSSSPETVNHGVSSVCQRQERGNHPQSWDQRQGEEELTGDDDESYNSWDDNNSWGIVNGDGALGMESVTNRMQRWSAQLSKLHELGFKDDKTNVEIMERLEAAHIGSGESEEISVERVVNEILKE